MISLHMINLKAAILNDLMYVGYYSRPVSYVSLTGFSALFIKEQSIYTN